MDYKESHVFPSGLEIDYYSTPDENYHDELKAVSSQEELAAFVERWRYLCPEINHPVSFETLKLLRGDIKAQESFLEKSKEDPSCEFYINLLLPSSILIYMMKARRFGVTTGVVILQLWNGGVFDQSEDGTWNLRLKTQPQPES